MHGMIRIQVLLSGRAREAVGHSDLEYVVVTPARLEHIWTMLRAKYPSLIEFRDDLRFTINGQDAEISAELNSDDEVSICPTS